MQNKYRLRANQYDRETEDEKIRPYRIYYIAVEGNATEKEYFEGLSAYAAECLLELVGSIL